MNKIIFIIGLFILALSPLNTVNAQLCDTNTQQCDVNYDPANPNNTPGYNNSQNQNGSQPQQGGNPQQQPQQQPPEYNACVVIRSMAEFNNCCSYVGGDMSDSCWSYYNSAEYNRCILAPQDPSCVIPGQATGGVPSTNPINNSGANNDANSGRPSGSSEEVSSCNNIKFKSLLDILIWVRCIISTVIIPMIFTLAFLFFLWGVFKFMRATDSTKKEEAKKFIFWGLLGLFVMVGVWGIIRLAGDTLGVDTKGIPYLQTEYLDPKKGSN